MDKNIIILSNEFERSAHMKEYKINLYKDLDEDTIYLPVVFPAPYTVLFANFYHFKHSDSKYE